jgi:hypothetical protein
MDNGRDRIKKDSGKGRKAERKMEKYIVSSISR